MRHCVVAEYEVDGSAASETVHGRPSQIVMVHNKRLHPFVIAPCCAEGHLRPVSPTDLADACVGTQVVEYQAPDSGLRIMRPEGPRPSLPHLFSQAFRHRAAREAPKRMSASLVTSSGRSCGWTFIQSCRPIGCPSVGPV